MTQRVKEREHLIISPSDYDKSLRWDCLRRSGGEIKTCEPKAALLLFVCFAPQKCTSNNSCLHQNKNKWSIFIFRGLQFPGSNSAVQNWSAMYLINGIYGVGRWKASPINVNYLSFCIIKSPAEPPASDSANERVWKNTLRHQKQPRFFMNSAHAAFKAWLQEFELHNFSTGGGMQFCGSKTYWSWQSEHAADAVRSLEPPSVPPTIL